MIPFDVLTRGERQIVRYALGFRFVMLSLVLVVGAAYLLRLIAALAGSLGSALVAVAILTVSLAVGAAMRRS